MKESVGLDTVSTINLQRSAARSAGAKITRDNIYLMILTLSRMQETEISGLKGTQHHYVNTLPLSLFYQQASF